MEETARHIKRYKAKEEINSGKSLNQQSQHGICVGRKKEKEEGESEGENEGVGMEGSKCVKPPLVYS